MIYTTHTEDFIRQLYTKIGITKPHQLNYMDIANCLGIRVFPAPYEVGPSQALFAHNIPFIFLENHLTPARRWQDFCHELCHVLLHTGNQASMPHSWIEYQENKANHFMFHACIPSFMLDELDLYDNNAINAQHIQHLFTVEYDFAVKRLTQYISNKRIYAELAYRKSLQEL
ncbi:ImmA/IrrE family metallo-endopeptidase [Lysinibacillus sphaericus]|uniref:ImmA/IrrE family metallo-endopeptidase n=1 Tax=Lysinibacillus sphaericus TaxID=1421 RepID=UPI0021614627|nr:ImmA/IrrE family metallo-endopeptidase [Lysinibacillus sphaericus]MCS1382766.1 ImmA/IrrE family metallo-endopeptidase [Lysinibacillus sphaericus]